MTPGAVAEPTLLTEELREKIRAYLPRYPDKRAVTLPALHIVHRARAFPLRPRPGDG
jgi:NADH-quinone oxidoreductase subunit E